MSDEREEARLIEEFGFVPEPEDWGVALAAWAAYHNLDRANSMIPHSWNALSEEERLRWLRVSIISQSVADGNFGDDDDDSSHVNHTLASIVLGVLVRRNGGKICVLESEIANMSGSWVLSINHDCRTKTCTVAINKRVVIE